MNGRCDVEAPHHLTLRAPKETSPDSARPAQRTLTSRGSLNQSRTRSFVLSSVLLAAIIFPFVISPLAANERTKTDSQAVETTPFRPESGTFAPLEKAHTYRGELVFVDHPNRRGSIRVQGSGKFRMNEPHPFALLPYGIVRYHAAPADLRDIPLGTVLHVSAFLPPDPSTSSVPVLPVNNKTKDANHGRGVGIFPAENHALLVEDEPSHCQRNGLSWKLKEVQIKSQTGTLIASRQPKDNANGNLVEETLSVDAATRIWRGRECLLIENLIDEGSWPADGTKSLEGQSVHLGITWKPTPGGVFTRFHVSDIWMDDAALKNAAQRQTEIHKAFIRARWMPAWVDAVEYGKFGRATITATLFGGMAPSLYADLKPGITALMNGAENTLKHTEGGTAGPTQMAARGRLLDVKQIASAPPIGSSGIQIRFETDLITEGMRPKRVVKVRPENWPDVHLPREEYVGNGASNLDERFPTPAIFPTY
jgi:hypothetical protein